MEFTKYEIRYAWETALRVIETSDNKNPLSTLVPQIRSHLDAVERALKRLWDEFEESEWRRAEREALFVHDEIAAARNRLLDLIHEAIAHDQDHRDGVPGDSPHHGEPAA